MRGHVVRHDQHRRLAGTDEVTRDAEHEVRAYTVQAVQMRFDHLHRDVRPAGAQRRTPIRGVRVPEEIRGLGAEAAWLAKDAGNHALVFHPNSPDGKAGMALEVLRLTVPEFLKEGNVMTRTPPGESVLKLPVAFEAATETAPALAIGLVAEGKRLVLTIHYGDRKLAQELEP